MTHGHEIVVCSCGAVLRQCRCIGPKTETIVSNGCPSCRQKAAAKVRAVMALVGLRAEDATP